MTPRVFTARTFRGPCAGINCGKQIVPGERYMNTMRYATEHERDVIASMRSDERPYLSQGRIAIRLHEGCEHPGITVRKHEANEADRLAFRSICRDGTVPSVRGTRATCPACGGKGCKR